MLVIAESFVVHTFLLAVLSILVFLENVYQMGL